MFVALLELILDVASDWAGNLLYRAASALKRGVVHLSRSVRLASVRRKRQRRAS